MKRAPPTLISGHAPIPSKFLPYVSRTCFVEYRVKMSLLRYGKKVDCFPTSENKLRHVGFPFHPYRSSGVSSLNDGCGGCPIVNPPNLNPPISPILRFCQLFPPQIFPAIRYSLLQHIRTCFSLRYCNPKTVSVMLLYIVNTMSDHLIRALNYYSHSIPSKGLFWIQFSLFQFYLYMCFKQ